ncbi:DUF1153 domain-containing protein [Ruficoccus sp. ZRK36]|uniref:DUF1153 domain-containing protein n=1 Tax=Ruficoccus sp. ZRK36 TaxID=2866311 RepID=UPI001C73D021|nr:DUF1153 domain-containing protein [Ruficoccus sp. ZRK36]QYY36458.1 DUF1153 domain-containing protein [Ruficoccus sp. ZRK36]
MTDIYLAKVFKDWVNAPDNAGTVKRLRMFVTGLNLALFALLGYRQTLLDLINVIILGALLLSQILQSKLVTIDERINKYTISLLTYQTRLKRHGAKGLKVIRITSVAATTLTIIACFASTLEDAGLVPIITSFALFFLACKGLTYTSKPSPDKMLKELGIDPEHMIAIAGQEQTIHSS